MRWMLIALAVITTGTWLLFRPGDSPTFQPSEHIVSESRPDQAEASHSTSEPALLPNLFEGITLGTTLSSVRARRAIEAPEQTELGLVYVEPLSETERAVYIFRNDRLVLVQHLRRSSPEDAPELLRQTITRLGSPASTWNCAGEAGSPLPTQRLVWRNETVAAQEILLVHPTGVSLTFIAGSAHDISQSLERSNCRPMTSSTDLAPTATTEQLRRAATSH